MGTVCWCSTCGVHELKSSLVACLLWDIVMLYCIESSEGESARTESYPSCAHFDDDTSILVVAVKTDCITHVFSPAQSHQLVLEAVPTTAHALGYILQVLPDNTSMK